MSKESQTMRGDVVLPVSKKTIRIDDRELTGRDREQADIVRIQSGGSTFAWFHATLSRVCSFVDRDPNTSEPVVRQLVPEDISAMSTRDIDAITEALKGDPRFFPPDGGGRTPPVANLLPI